MAEIAITEHVHRFAEARDRLDHPRRGPADPADAEAGEQDLGERAQVNDRLMPVKRGERRQWLTFVAQRAVRVVLDDRHLVARGQCQQPLPAVEAHRRAGRVLERRQGIDQLGTPAWDQVLQQADLHPMLVNRDR